MSAQCAVHSRGDHWPPVFYLFNPILVKENKKPLLFFKNYAILKAPNNMLFLKLYTHVFKSVYFYPFGKNAGSLHALKYEYEVYCLATVELCVFRCGQSRLPHFLFRAEGDVFISLSNLSYYYF